MLLNGVLDILEQGDVCSTVVLIAILLVIGRHMVSARPNMQTWESAWQPARSSLTPSTTEPLPVPLLLRNGLVSYFVGFLRRLSCWEFLGSRWRYLGSSTTTPSFCHSPRRETSQVPLGPDLQHGVTVAARNRSSDGVPKKTPTAEHGSESRRKSTHKLKGGEMMHGPVPRSRTASTHTR